MLIVDCYCCVKSLFFFRKKPCCFHLVYSLGEGEVWREIKKLAGGRGLGRNPKARGLHRDPYKAAGLGRLVAVETLCFQLI